MSELGEVLELLHRARERWTTVRATIRAWRHHQRTMGAWEAFRESDSGWTSYGLLAGDDGDPPEPETSESSSRLWIDSERVRLERDDVHSYLGIRVGRLWWHYDEVNGAISNEDNPEHGSGVGEEFRHLFDPSGISGGMHFDVVGSREVTAREGIAVRAVPRPTRDPHHHLHLPHGADEHELVVDAKRGVLLRLASRYRGEEFYVVELTEIAFDERLDDDLFVFHPPAGERVRTAGAGLALHDLSIEEVQRRTSFLVWIPRELDPGWDMRAHYISGDDRPRMPEAVHIHYSRRNASHQFAIHETAVGERDEWGGWETRERDGEQLLVASEPQAQVRLERDGTQITIHSQRLELERLLELVDLLVPAPDEPPPLSAGRNGRS